MISLMMFILIAAGVIWLAMCVIFGLLKFTFKCAGLLVILPAAILVAIPVGMFLLW